MICRIWHGWTSEENAAVYERLLRSEIVAGILRREIPGFQAIDLLRRSGPDGAEFVTLMCFDSIEAVQRFAGLDYEMAVVPPHLVLFKSVYDELAIFTRQDPLIPLGLLSMLMQGLIVSYLYPSFAGGRQSPV
jgi:heme-degrading monooxygenase HmoA